MLQQFIDNNKLFINRLPMIAKMTGVYCLIGVVVAYFLLYDKFTTADLSASDTSAMGAFVLAGLLVLLIITLIIYPLMLVSTILIYKDPEQNAVIPVLKQSLHRYSSIFTTLLMQIGLHILSILALSIILIPFALILLNSPSMMLPFTFLSSAVELAAYIGVLFIILPRYMHVLYGEKPLPLDHNFKFMFKSYKPLILSFVILKFIDVFIGLRVTEEEEVQGLDQTCAGT